MVWNQQQGSLAWLHQPVQEETQSNDAGGYNNVFPSYQTVRVRNSRVQRSEGNHNEPIRFNFSLKCTQNPVSVHDPLCPCLVILSQIPSCPERIRNTTRGEMLGVALLVCQLVSFKSDHACHSFYQQPPPPIRPSKHCGFWWDGFCFWSQVRQLTLNIVYSITTWVNSPPL